LHWLRKERPDCGFVVGTAYGSVSHAVEAIQAGADDYLTKPFKRQELLLALEKASRATRLRQTNRQLQQALGEQQQLVELIGSAPCMQQLFQRIQRISHADVPVLISGESGTGKELAARALHQLSSRRAGPFIALNCGAIPESLAEAELFGAEKGAYTGAVASKAGKFEAAQQGTLFLDEIAELPLSLQAKLLRGAARKYRHPPWQSPRNPALGADHCRQPSRFSARGARRAVSRRSILSLKRGAAAHAPPARARGRYPPFD